MAGIFFGPRGILFAVWMVAQTLEGPFSAVPKQNLKLKLHFAEFFRDLGD